MTKIEAMGPSSIKRLNQMARAIAKQGFEPFDAVELAASRYGLISVCVNERVVLYRTKRNKYVVCWTDFRYVGDGGAGFDDQVELFGDDIYPPLTDTQNHIIERLGQDTAWDDVRKRYKGKSMEWIRKDLKTMCPDDDNEPLAYIIYEAMITE